MGEEIKLDESDVYVTPLDVDACEGGCEDGAITHYVSLDLRANGRMSEVWRGCEPCAESFAESLRASLSREDELPDIGDRNVDRGVLGRRYEPES